MPVPNSKGIDITARIETLSKRNDVSPFEVKSLQRDIDRLTSVDPAEGYMLGGMLAAMTGKREIARSLHEKSLRLEYDVVGLFNYGVSMKKVGELTLAKSIFVKADELAPGDKDVFAHHVQAMNFSLDYRNFHQVVSSMEKTRPEWDVREVADVNLAYDIVEQLEALEVSLVEYSKFGVHVEQALLKYDLSSTHVSEHFSHFDGVPHMFTEFFVDSNSAAVLYDVNEHLMDLILGDEALINWEKVVLSVVRMEQEPVGRDGLEHSAA